MTAVLIGADWYDDGPVDVARQFEFLAEGSPFRRSLESIEPESLTSELRRLAGDLAFDELVVPMVIALPEIGRRPELAAALLSSSQLSRLPAEACRRAALLVEGAGAHGLATRLADRVAEHVRTMHRRHCWSDVEALEFLARARPSLALRVLRDTRDRGVRSLRAEERAERLMAAAAATLALSRRKQARELFELAARARGPREIKREAARRARELD